MLNAKPFFVFLILAAAGLYVGCGENLKTSAVSEQATQSKSERELSLVALHPAAAMAGEVFNAQPGGEAALAVQCSGATANTVIVFGEHELKTVFGGATLLSAEVPRGLYKTPGTYSVFLKDGTAKSNAKTFMIQTR